MIFSLMFVLGLFIIGIILIIGWVRILIDAFREKMWLFVISYLALSFVLFGLIGTLLKLDR